MYSRWGSFSWRDSSVSMSSLVVLVTGSRFQISPKNLPKFVWSLWSWVLDFRSRQSRFSSFFFLYVSIHISSSVSRSLVTSKVLQPQIYKYLNKPNFRPRYQQRCRQEGRETYLRWCTVMEDPFVLWIESFDVKFGRFGHGFRSRRKTSPNWFGRVSHLFSSFISPSICLLPLLEVLWLEKCYNHGFLISDLPEKLHQRCT